MSKGPNATTLAALPASGAAAAAATATAKTEAKSSASSSRWNTKNLGPRILSDALSAACAASLVAPLISIIDRSVMENASGRAPIHHSILSSLRLLLTRPQALLFSRPAALIFLTYGSTYLTTNAVDTLHSTTHSRPASTVTAGTAKFAIGSATNIGAGIYKDKVFVQLFGPPGAAARRVPLGSYALFAARDCITIFASFNIPPLLGPYISERLGEGMKQHISGTSTAQFLAPAAVQAISTPLHLLGLDLYNRPHGTDWRERWAIVRRNWAVSCAARVCRIVPAFGIGGVVNTKVRRNLMQRWE